MKAERKTPDRRYRSMDLYIVQVDGLDVSFTYSQEAALEHGRRLCLEEPALKVQVLRVRDGCYEELPDFSEAEAATV
jgi:hypothetical protein